MPDVHEFDLPEILSDLGFCQNTGMGLQPVSFCEMTSYLDGQQITLDSWGFRMLRAMSCAFVAGSNAPNEAPPFMPIETRMAYSCAKNLRTAKTLAPDAPHNTQ